MKNVLPNMKNFPEPGKKVLNAYTEETYFDLSIKEVSKKTNLDRLTVSKYIAVLEAYGILRQTRKVGNAKFYKLAYDASKPDK